METLRKTPIELIHDQDYEDEIEPYFGKYLGTFVSARGQVRADLFDTGADVNAYVSFPTGMTASNVEDGYVNELYSFAVDHGFRDRFQLLYIE